MGLFRIYLQVICPGNVPQLFGVGICRIYVPWLFAVGLFCGGDLPQLFAVGLFCVCKQTFLLCERIFFFVSKAFLYESKTFFYLREFHFQQCFFLLLPWQLWTTVPHISQLRISQKLKYVIMWKLRHIKISWDFQICISVPKNIRELSSLKSLVYL